MSYNVKKKLNKFTNTFDKGIEYLNENHYSTNASKNFIFQSGIVNLIWQSWNALWRTYWLAEIRGGIDIYNKPTIPYASNLTEEEAISFLLKGVIGGKTKHWEEKTWGDVKWISKVAANMYNLDPTLVPALPIAHKAQTILSVISLLGNSISHLQLVRNCSIHVDEFNVQKIRSILIHYTIPNFKYPTDVMLSKNTSDGKKAIVSWQEELNTILSFI